MSFSVRPSSLVRLKKVFVQFLEAYILALVPMSRKSPSFFQAMQTGVILLDSWSNSISIPGARNLFTDCLNIAITDLLDPSSIPKKVKM